MEELRYKKGHALTGEAVDSYLYIVVEGRLGMRHDGQVTASAGGGELFFEPGLLDGGEAESELVVLEDSRVLRLTRQAFTRIMEERFTVVCGLLSHLSAVVRSNGQSRAPGAVVAGATNGGGRRRFRRARRGEERATV